MRSISMIALFLAGFWQSEGFAFFKNSAHCVTDDKVPVLHFQSEKEIAKKYMHFYRIDHQSLYSGRMIDTIDKYVDEFFLVALSDTDISLKVIQSDRVLAPQGPFFGSSSRKGPEDSYFSYSYPFRFPGSTHYPPRFLGQTTVGFSFKGQIRTEENKFTTQAHFKIINPGLTKEQDSIVFLDRDKPGVTLNCQEDINTDIRNKSDPVLPLWMYQLHFGKALVEDFPFIRFYEEKPKIQ